MWKTAKVSEESSNDHQQELETGESIFKKRRTPGACDTCKRKKIRCDSSETPGNRCTNCTEAGLECTHKVVSRALGPAKGYVESLEGRLEKLDKLMTKLLPGIDVNKELERIDETDILPRNDDEANMVTVQFGKLKLNPEQNRFCGKSSQYQLLRTVLDWKQDYTGEPYQASKGEKRWKRDIYWDIPEWTGPDVLHDHWKDTPTYTYPPEDLMPSLIDAYFTYVNPFFPLLHRPTFERSIAEGLHHTDSQFGANLLLVCAHGANYSDDRRVLIEGQDWLSSGWKWFNQVQLFRKSLFHKVSLGELQAFALHAQFLLSGPVPQGVWAEIGYALRLALEVGAHRKRKKNSISTAEDELWKRAFWVIFAVDRRLSAKAGRTSGVQDEDFDLDFPLECDDEYWDHDFVQPPGKPSSMAFFNCYLRLMNIFGQAMRLIYSIKRPTSSLQGPPRSDQDIVVELDSMLNSWMDCVPPHLKWRTHDSSPLFQHQSALLHASYYNLQIFIHWPFVPSPRNLRPSSFPSLAICTNAARSCCHVLEPYSRENPAPFKVVFEVIFVAAVVLLLNIWSGKRSGFAPNPRRELEDVKRCMQILRASEDRWFSAGKYYDILVELACADDMPDILPPRAGELDVPQGKKRSRHESEEDDSTPSSSGSSPSADGTRKIAGKKRALEKSSLLSSKSSETPSGANFSLPITSGELGALPIYGQFSFSDSIASTFPTTMDFVGGQDPYAALFGDSIFPNLIDGSGPNVLDSSSTSFQQSQFPGVDIALPNGSNSTSVVPDIQAAGNSRDFQPEKPLASSVVPVAAQFQGGEDFSALFGLPEGSNLSAMMSHDNSSMSMWSMAPINMEFEDWNSYLTSMERVAQPEESFGPVNSQQ